MGLYLDIDLDAVEHNARELVTRLRKKGISVTGVTKATLGDPDIARAMLRGGVSRLGDSRIENLERMRTAGIRNALTLLRSPAPDDAGRVVRTANHSLVSDLDAARSLGAAAVDNGTVHGVVVMVELGDLREGVMPGEVEPFARSAAAIRGLVVLGVGTNPACRTGVAPTQEQMDQLGELAQSIGPHIGLAQAMVSGGNSANLAWVFGGGRVGAINDLRLGESILLGVDPLTGAALPGLRQDAFALCATVIESREKRLAPTETGNGLSALGAHFSSDGRTVMQTILAVGRQDTDPEGLRMPEGISLLAATSDHLMVQTPSRLAAGAEVRMGLTYAALMRAMTSPFVARLRVPVAA